MACPAGSACRPSPGRRTGVGGLQQRSPAQRAGRDHDERQHHEDHQPGDRTRPPPRPAQPELPRVDAGSRQPDHQGQQRQAPFEDEQPHVERPPRLRIGAQPPLEPAVQHVPGDGLADDQVTGDHDPPRRPGRSRGGSPAARPCSCRRSHAGSRGRHDQASARSTASAPARSAGYSLVNSTHRPSAGCGEGQPDGVQPLPGQPEPGGQRRVGAVGEVADARVPQRREVHPDLVGAAGLQLDVDAGWRPGTPRSSRSA